ncbi:aminotransferase class V-fold PLP-dependent enzyme [Aquaticitalea lipolytica]|uniref:aminotransferase class V-fold PLP-dependent enzyme n=1 Tax=Aquaticitalea lipolytica TaxID=1247562 RepID=UPI0024BA400A|nr:aminotransferase class V-fold PLP-dependent enzyme [Aquaticitalea lipolytica]
MSLQHQKHLFDIPEEITYLNIAAQSPSFKSIYEAGLEGLKQKNRPYSITIPDYFEPVIELKKLFAELVDVDDYNRIATIPAVSYGIATVANNIKLNAGDEIIVIHEQFPSNIYAWQKLADKYNAVIKTIKAPNTDVNRVKQWNESIIDAISDKTAVVAMGNIHWSNGSLFDLKTIRQKTKTHNALLIIDGSQSVGVLPFSVKEIQPDALICAGYKWLFGPYGCAYAYYGAYFDNGVPIEENWSNRLNSENFSGLTNYESQYKPLANRYSVGESGNFIYVRMQIAALKQVIEWSPKKIQEYCKTISANAVKDLRALGCVIEDDNYRSHHLFGIKLPDDLDVNILKSVLAEQHIFVSFRGNYIRISCHLFNTSEDFKKLVACMSSVLQKA